MNGCERRCLIDVDKCGIELQRTNRKYGYSFAGVRVVKPGHYSRDAKVTILLAIEPGDPVLDLTVRESVANPRRLLSILVKPGASTLDFNDFMVHICNNLQTNHPHGMTGNESRVFYGIILPSTVVQSYIRQ